MEAEVGVLSKKLSTSTGLQCTILLCFIKKNSAQVQDYNVLSCCVLSKKLSTSTGLQSTILLCFIQKTQHKYRITIYYLVVFYPKNSAQVQDYNLLSCCVLLKKLSTSTGLQCTILLCFIQKTQHKYRITMYYLVDSKKKGDLLE